MAHDVKMLLEGPDAFVAHVETQIAALAHIDFQVKAHLEKRVVNGQKTSRLYPLLNDLHDLSGASPHSQSTVRTLMSEVPKKAANKVSSGELSKAFTSAPVDIQRIIDLSKQAPVATITDRPAAGAKAQTP